MEELSSEILASIDELKNSSDDLLVDKLYDTGFDAFCFVIEKPRALNFLKRLELSTKLRLTNRNKSICEYTDKKFGLKGIENLTGSIKHPYRKRYINFKRYGKSLTNTLIMIENSPELNELCRKRKKAYGSYVMIVFAGLYQPSRELLPATLRTLRAFLKRFNTWWVDIAKDIKADDESLKKEKFKDVLKNISKDDTIIQCGDSKNGITLYANNCIGDIKKVLIYDKFSKESIYHKQALLAPLKKWRRIEMRVNLKKRFSKVSKGEIDYYNTLLDDIALRYSWRVLWGTPTHTLDKQMAYFADGRRIFSSGVKLKEWVA
ncbi:hypothetical protein [Campylobacter corcagiensis]|uniref:Uncharacterized protein n=1 Tax=Campylobacter corcagiensis TaxID=1448857 RepID=A0A7M1LFC8_9BACT|nr:hypothetical protein [Campylobacter corcagiensis]QKF64521.1 hypothetical protein CCORG_0655 [Campylobacter corcagiensis]QOQ87302.1 hypothetical protein IMC76_00285 [Campylobacter corcagiensis]